MKRSDYIKFIFDNNDELECIKIKGDNSILYIFRNYAYLTDNANNEVLESIIDGENFIDKAFKEFDDLEDFLDEALNGGKYDYVVDFD